MKKGDLVVVWEDFAEYAHIAYAKSDVFKNKNGKDVIFIEGISGYYHCTHVRPAKFQENVSSAEAQKLPFFSKYKNELNASLRKYDDPVLKDWYLAGACKMLSILKRGYAYK